MAADRQHKLELRDIRSLPPNSEIFDGGPDAVRGFGARRRSGSSVTYCVMARGRDGRLRRLTIGRHGDPWTTEQARGRARKMVAEVKLGRRTVSPPRKAGAPIHYDDDHLLWRAAEFLAWPDHTGIKTDDHALRTAIIEIRDFPHDDIAKTVERLRKKFRKVKERLIDQSKKSGIPPTPVHIPHKDDLYFGSRNPGHAKAEATAKDLHRVAEWVAFLETKLSEQIDAQDGVNPDLLKHSRRLIHTVEREHARLDLPWEQ
jgi:hypothetical protein